MAIVLSEESWNQLWEASWQQARCGDPTDSSDWVVEYPSQLATGYKREIELRNGINLTLHNSRFHENLTVNSAQTDKNGYLEFVFNLSSVNRYWQGDYVAGGQHYLLSPAGQSWFYCEELAKEPKLAVDIHLEADLFKRLMGDCLDKLPCALRRMIESDDCLSVSPFQAITPTMRLALEQILNCPYQGTMKQLHLESKSIELLVLFLDQATTEAITAIPRIRLKPDDIERIHQAKQILTQQIDNPPSLLALARQVGLNECTLKRGFRQMFGTTVFGYVGDRRMEQARYLLLQGEMKVEEVAQAVGYANRSRFASAFRKKFGVNPKSYLIEYRRLG